MAPPGGAPALGSLADSPRMPLARGKGQAGETLVSLTQAHVLPQGLWPLPLRTRYPLGPALILRSLKQIGPVSKHLGQSQTWPPWRPHSVLRVQSTRCPLGTPASGFPSGQNEG